MYDRSSWSSESIGVGRSTRSTGTPSVGRKTISEGLRSTRNMEIITNLPRPGRKRLLGDVAIFQCSFNWHAFFEGETPQFCCSRRACTVRSRIVPSSV